MRVDTELGITTRSLTVERMYLGWCNTDKETLQNAHHGELSTNAVYDMLCLRNDEVVIKQAASSSVQLEVRSPAAGELARKSVLAASGAG